jgi:hypothetical protein
MPRHPIADEAASAGATPGIARTPNASAERTAYVARLKLRALMLGALMSDHPTDDLDAQAPTGTAARAFLDALTKPRPNIPSDEPILPDAESQQKYRDLRDMLTEIGIWKPESRELLERILTNDARCRMGGEPTKH